MLTLTSKRALAITISVVLAPFFLISIYSFFYIRINTSNHFDETIFRFTSNSAHNCIENPIRKINVLFSSLSGVIDKYDINQYLSSNNAELNLLIPSLVNANEMLSSVLISDNQDNYKIYPPFELEDYKPSSRPWYHRDGFKDQVFYSEPYISAKKTNSVKKKEKSISVSMNLFDKHSEFIGNIAFDLSFIAMSNNMQGLIVPYNGHFKVAAMDGSVIMSSNVKDIFTRNVPASWINEAKDTSGYFRDDISKEIVFYQTYQNPDWVAFTAVDIKEYNKLLNDSYIVLVYVILACIFCYLIMALICRTYFKQWIDTLYKSINGDDSNELPHNFSGLYQGIAKKNETLKEAVHAASTDTLTKIGSRRRFEQDSLNLVRSNTPFHLAMIDLDNFKKINDTYGHPTGDFVLQHVSKIGLERLGGTHSIYRFGGEELVAIFCGITFAECYEIVDSWRYTVSRKKWREQNLTVTFSCGIASSGDGKTLDEIIASADKSLYEAKESGKNCIYPPLS